MKLFALPVWVMALMSVFIGIALRWSVDGAGGLSSSTPDAVGLSVRAEANPQQTQPKPPSIPTEVLAWTDQLSASQLEQDIGSERFRRWVLADPDAAFKRVQAIPNSELRIKAMKAVLGELADHDLDQARNAFAAMTDQRTKPFMAEFFAKTWAGRDATAAWDFMKTLSKDDYQTLWARGVISAVIQDDGKAAAAMVEALPLGDFGGMRYQLVDLIGKEWAPRDPRAAAEFAIKNSFLSSYGSPFALFDAVRIWTGQDAEAAIDWMKQMPPGKEKDASAGGIFHALFEKEPGAAMEIFPEMDVESRKSASRTITYSLLFPDANRALQWWGGLPDDEAKATAARWLAVNWAEGNPAAAAQWAKDLSPGAAQDQAIEGIYDRLTDRKTGAELSAFIRDEGVRKSRLRRWATWWLIEDPDAATRWINSAPSLTKEMRADLLGK